MTHGQVGGLTTARGSFAIEPRGAFSLESSIRFLEGFAPAAYEAPPARTLDFAFALEGSWQTVGVSVDQVGTEVRGRVFARRPLKRDDLSAVRSQVERILSLDVDGTGFDGGSSGAGSVGERDTVVGAVQKRYPGLRPVGFWSWYEAAAWAIIGQRVRIAQAAATKERLAVELGEAIEVNGVMRQAFPAPVALATVTAMPGLTRAKVERLRALAECARRNEFDSASLRALPRDEALEALQTLPGVGPFSAELILLRGAGDPDWAPLHEKHLATAVAHAYGLDAPASPEQIAAISEGWAPYRTWVTLLLRVQLEDDRQASGAVGG
jgi:DNA-3-methyladenine glycosylase II